MVLRAHHAVELFLSEGHPSKSRDCASARNANERQRGKNASGRQRACSDRHTTRHWTAYIHNYSSGQGGIIVWCLWLRREA
jgi:hypothetical protein